jgi:hypothetical protein
MNEEERTAIGFLASPRGRYIIGQALYHGVRALKQVEPDVMREKSNIDDMEYLRETLFNFPDLFYMHEDIAHIDRKWKDQMEMFTKEVN